MIQGSTISLVSVLTACAWLCLACDEKKDETTSASSEAMATQQPSAAAPAKSAEQQTAEAAAEAAADKAREEAEKEQAAVDENPITECCRALGKKGFTERSPEYMAASKVCGEALTAQDALEKALPGIKTALKSQPLPSECAPR